MWTVPEGETATALAPPASEGAHSNHRSTGVLAQLPAASDAWRNSRTEPFVLRYTTWLWPDRSMAMHAPLPTVPIVVAAQPPGELGQYRIEAMATSPGGPVRGGNASCTTGWWSF